MKNHGLYTDTAWMVAITFRDTAGAALDLSGADYIAGCYDRNGGLAFTFKSSGAAASDGVIGTTQAASGILTFTASPDRHAAVTAGLYRVHLKRDLADDVWQAQGTLLVGAPADLETYLLFDAFEGGTAAVVFPIIVGEPLGAYVSTRAELSAADKSKSWTLTENNRDGLFQYLTATEIQAVFDMPAATALALDSRQGILVAASDDPTGTLGAWVRQSFGRMSPRQFGAVADGVTDDSAAINAAMTMMWACYHNTLGIYLMQVDGEGRAYGAASPINCTEVAYGRGAGVLNMVVNASCTGVSVFDFTGSRFLHLDGLVVRGSLTSPPAIGFYFGRLSTGATSDGHAIGDIEAYGSFSVAGVINYASEVFHADSIRVANQHPAATAAGAIFTGHDDTIFNHCGVRPSSTFKTVQTGSESLSDVYIDRLNIQRVSAYTYAITSISKANPAVVTISTANMATAIASYGLANGASIFLDNIVGSDSGATGFGRSIGFQTYTVANINAGAGTFELSGCDTTSVTGTFTSGWLRNDTGPALVIGQTGILRASGYIESYSRAKVKVDTRTATDWLWDVEITGRHETAGRNSIEFVGDTTARSVKRFSYRTDNQLAVVAPVAISGCSGAGVITFTACEFITGRGAQIPSTTFENPTFGAFRNALVQVQAASLVQTPDAFAGFTGVWHADDTAIPIAVGTERNLSNVAGDVQSLIENTDPGSAAGPIVDYYRNSGSPTAFDLLAQLDFSGNNSSGIKKAFAYLRTQIISPTAGSEKGAASLFVKEAGVDLQVLYADARGLQRIDRTATNANDADASLTPTAHHVQQFFTAALTADRTVTLSTASAADGDRFMVARTGGGAFSLNFVGPGALCSLAKNQWAVFKYDGTAAAWKLFARGDVWSEAGGTIRVIGSSGISIDSTGDTLEHVLATVTVPAFAMGKNGFVRITSFWETTGNTNSKRMRVRFGGAAGTAYTDITAASATGLTHQFMTIIHNANATNSQQGQHSNYIGLGNNVNGAKTTSAVDTTADTTVVLSAQCVTAGTDHIYLHGYSVEVVYAP